MTIFMSESSLGALLNQDDLQHIKRNLTSNIYKIII